MVFLYRLRRHKFKKKFETWLVSVFQIISVWRSCLNKIFAGINIPKIAQI